MACSTEKDLLEKTAERLPENASVENARKRLLFLAKIEKGTHDTETGQTISHDDMQRRLGL